MPKESLHPHLVPLQEVPSLELEQKQQSGGEMVSRHFSPGDSGVGRLREERRFRPLALGAGTVETPLN